MIKAVPGDLSVSYYQRTQTVRKSYDFRRHNLLIQPSGESALHEPDIPVTMLCGLEYTLDGLKSPYDERIGKFLYNPLTVVEFFHGRNQALKAGDVTSEVINQVAIRLQRLREGLNGRDIYFVDNGRKEKVTPKLEWFMRVEGSASELAYLTDRVTIFVPEKPSQF